MHDLPFAGNFRFQCARLGGCSPNRLYSTATGNPSTTSTTAPNGTYPAGNITLSPYVTPGNNYGSGFSFSASTGVATQAASTTLVISPIATACSACHDSTLDISHMTSNGGSFYEARATALLKTEQCTLCHLTGKVADIAAMHAQ